MARNGSGTYSRVEGPYVYNTIIDQVEVNAELDDIATALTNSLTKNGETTPTANLPMGNFKLTGLAAGAGNGESVRYEQVADVATVQIHAATAKTPVVDADELPIVDSAASWGLKKFTLTTLWTWITTHAGTTYAALAGSASNGWTYANNGADATNDIDIAAGSGLDSTRAYWITGTAKTKQLDAAWAVGSAAGGLDTGAIGDSDYYIWAIARSDTGAVDYLFSLSSTAPTMPANYDYKRLIGWIKRVAGTIVAFHTYETEGGGIEMNWDSPTLDINLTNTLTTSRRTDAIKVPLNFSVLANLTVRIADAAAFVAVQIECPDKTDVAVSGFANNTISQIIVTGKSQVFNIKVRTSATGTIAARADTATLDTYEVATLGFTWARRA